jgi:flagellar basal-body rod modification protein FlgD
MNIGNNVSQATQATAPTSSLGSYGNDIVKQEDFFKLLIAQLKNQDPTKPADNQEFMGQLAQFSSLEHLSNQTKLLEQLLARQQGDAATQALSLIGKDVTVNNEPVHFEPGDEIPYLFHTDGPTNVMVQVNSASGRVVHTEMVSVNQAGQHEYIFKGEGEDGLPLIAGNYTVTFGSGVNSNGSQQQLTSFMLGHVDGVNFFEGEPILMVNGQNIPMSSIMAVYESGEDEA